MLRVLRKPLLPLFNEAFQLIDKLEHAVVTCMVTLNFTVDQALYAMYDPDTVDKLKAAWPLIRTSDRTHFVSERVIFPTVGAAAITVAVTIHARDARVLVPEPGNLKMERVLAFEPLVRCIQEVEAQHRPFEKLRRVVRWLNENATPGAAKHYCPWLTALLPQDHAFHQVDGLLYKEPAEGIGKIFGDMRECAAIMAGAILVGDLNQNSERNRFMVMICGSREGEDYISQTFRLI